VSDVEPRARAAIDEAHSGDPERIEGRPAEAVYADRVEAWILQLVEEPSLALRLATRAQHLERWAIPRGEFPEGRGGYLRWRGAVQSRQGDRARELLSDAGGATPLADRVARLVAKTTPRDDLDAQALEDAACLVFLETDLVDFQRHHDRAKVVDIIKKTWRKMSPKGRELALTLALPAEAQELLRSALG